uniref:Uncharacterized protein n=1 Tax=Candidatus Kentrum sp. LFY TaxID=2126342 RepID=A0A450V718_9GAMM|nr:MAG: hypothetical protein BECKLFY1418A_GA0070994_112012 [Candidatus Kentron sp. LFY]
MVLPLDTAPTISLWFLRNQFSDGEEQTSNKMPFGQKSRPGERRSQRWPFSNITQEFGNFVFPIREHVSASRQDPNGVFLAQAPVLSEFLFSRDFKKSP